MKPVQLKRVGDIVTGDYVLIQETSTVRNESKLRYVYRARWDGSSRTLRRLEFIPFNRDGFSPWFLRNCLTLDKDDVVLAVHTAGSSNR